MTWIWSVFTLSTDLLHSSSSWADIQSQTKCVGSTLSLINSINSIWFKVFLQVISYLSANLDKYRKQAYTSPDFVPILYWFVVISKLSSIYWRCQGITWGTAACKADAQLYKYFFKLLCWSFRGNRSRQELKSKIDTGKNKSMKKTTWVAATSVLFISFHKHSHGWARVATERSKWYPRRGVVAQWLVG